MSLSILASCDLHIRLFKAISQKPLDMIAVALCRHFILSPDPSQRD